MKARAPEHLDLHRFPIDPWRLVEREYDKSDIGLTETIFAVGNGYLGMRANPEEGRDAYSHGTFINGFHETWHIHHAEEAFGFAKTGQTIVNVPDAKLMKLYVDDEPLLLGNADLESYERVLDFREGTLTRDLIWRTPGGKRVRVRSQRLVSLAHRHLAMLTFEVTMLDGEAPVVMSSQLLNRQDGEDEYHVAAAALGHGKDPRKMRTLRPPRAGAAHAPRARRRGRARLPLRQQRDDAGVRVPPHRRDHGAAPGRDGRRPRPGQDGRDCPPREPASRCASSSSSRTTRRRASRPRSWPIAATARCSGPRPTAWA